MPVSKSKQGKPLGGMGAERQTTRGHSLILDDRLMSKQYIQSKLDARVSDDAFGASWADVSNVAPSKGALNDKFNALSVTTSAWTQESSSATDSKTRTFDSGNVGIGSTLAYNNITEKLTVDGNIKSIGDILVGDDLSLTSDSSVFNMGVGNDFTITHDGTTGATIAGNPLTLDSAGDITLDADGGDVFFKDGGTTFGSATNTGGNLIVKSGTTTALTFSGANTTTSGNLTVTGDTTITGNLTVQGEAIATLSETTQVKDNFMLLNSDATGTPAAGTDVGIEVNRGSATNRKLFWDEGDDEWKIQTGDSTFTGIATGGGTLTGSNTGDVTIVLASGVPAGAVALSNQQVTLGDKFVYNEGTVNAIGVQGGADGKLSLYGTTGSSGTTGLVVEGGNSAANSAAVSVTGHLEATTKSFNIPHPLDNNKRLVYGSLEGPEHGMYGRGSYDVIDDRRRVAVDLPLYWSNMVYPDYTVGLAAYGNYNVWITKRDENGFWVETNAQEEWSFDWNVVGKRKDAKLVVEPGR